MEALIAKSLILSPAVKCVGYFSPVTLILASMLIGYIVIYNWKRARLVRLINKIPGPPALPIVGNTIEINVDHDGIYKFLISLNLICKSFEVVLKL